MTTETSPTSGTTAQPVLATARDLIADLAQEPTPVVLDVRWQLGDQNNHQQYLSGHIPGAQFINLSADLAAPPNVREGRHPLPSHEDFQAALRRAGVNNSDRVVIYDDSGSTSAARAWWLMRWAGKQNVFLLDGGLQAWIAEGKDLAVGPGNLVERGDFTFNLDHMRTAGIDEVATWPEQGILLDVRAPDRYAGITEPMDSRAGHIPGATNLPTASFLDERGCFLPAAQIREIFRGVGVTDGQDTVVYCGSGIHACHTLAAMEIAGLESGRLFPGSWSQWSADRERAVTVGTDPR